MATVTKDFRIKSGLVVEGTTGTINNSNILTEASTTFLENYVKDTAGGLLENAILTNIEITYDNDTNGLVITAENGIAESNTDQLTEGITNLYFTVDRAQDAVGELLSGGTHNGIEFSYDDTTNTLVATVTGASVPTFTTGIVFEGADPDNFETTLQVSEPTQDNTITLKDASGTLAFVSDITDAVDALDTDDIEEGTAQYFTEFRAQSAVSNALGTGLTYGDQGIGNVFLVDENYISTKQFAIDEAESARSAAVDAATQLAADAQANAISSASSDATQKAETAQQNAESFATGAANTAYTNAVADAGTHAQGIVDALTTDDIEEGTAKYFSDTLARGAVSAGEGLDYSSTTGEFSANLGTGLQFNVNGEIEIDGAVVVTQTNLNDAVDNHSDLATGVHGVTGNVVGTSDAQTLSNKTLGSSLDAGTFQVTNLGVPVNANDAATKTYVDTSVSNLIDSAPGALDTLNELAAALGDDANFSTTVTNAIAQKVSKAGDSMSGNLAMGANRVTGLATPVDTTDAANKGYVDEGITAHGLVTTGIHGVAGDVVGTSDTQTLTNKTLGSGTVLGASLDATNAYKVVNLQDPTSNQDAATKKYVDDEIVTVNGTIDALTTTDIAEGTRLYFTDARAVTALENVVPNFTEVDINDVATQVAAKTANPIATESDNNVVYQFSATEYRTAKLLVKAARSTHTQVSEILLTLDSSDNIAITEYAIVGTNGNLIDVSADISGGNVRILVDTTGVSTSVTVAGTLLK